MKPLLLLDVDGVLFPTSGTIPPGYKYHETDRYYAVLNPTHGVWLLELAEHFDLVWATSWEHGANSVIGPLLGIPELPVIEFQMSEGETRKLPSVQDFVGDRPVAWVDDELYADAREWAHDRTARTLLVETRPSVGITRAEVETLLAFAALYANDFDSDWGLPGRWLDHENLVATSPTNREVVERALADSNVVFGFHRWYYGGSAPDLVTMATIDEWDAEIERCKPGDNLMLVSLEVVASHALLHIRKSENVIASVKHADLAPAWEYLKSTSNELVAVTRHVASGGRVVSSAELVWDPDLAERDELLAEWSGTTGELWLFDTNVIWQPESLLDLTCEQQTA